MKKKRILFSKLDSHFLIFFLLILIQEMTCSLHVFSQGIGREVKKMEPFIVQFKYAKKEMPLLDGPPQTIGFRSGLVILEKGKVMEEHSTKHNEEVLVILEGRGEAIFNKGHSPILIQEGCILYIPPESIHSIKNTGRKALKYIYLVAPVRES